MLISRVPKKQQKEVFCRSPATNTAFEAFWAFHKKRYKSCVCRFLLRVNGKKDFFLLFFWHPTNFLFSFPIIFCVFFCSKIHIKLFSERRLQCNWQSFSEKRLCLWRWVLRWSWTTSLPLSSWKFRPLSRFQRNVWVSCTIRDKSPSPPRIWPRLCRFVKIFFKEIRSFWK